MEWRQSNGLRWLEANLGGARAAFSTRLGGVSEAPFDTLNLGLLTEDADEAVAENRRRLAAVLDFEPEEVVFARQVHGISLVDHRDESQEGPLQGDGHLVAEPGTAALVFVADCLPVALAGPGGVAMIHAGWRGLAGGILSAAAEAVEATAAAVGPGVGRCCYEVGEEVHDAFAALGEGIAEGPRLDLPEVARRSLANAGVGSVELAGLCTSCEEQLFFSHRRDRGRTGRQAGLAWVEG
jgi:YfiH family protein